MNKMNCNRLLPKKLRVNSAVNQLYRIGLLYTRSQYEEGATRSKIYHPKLINSILVICVTQIIIVTFIPSKYRLIKIMLGDFAYLQGNPKHINIFVINFVILNILFRVLYYYNYKRGIKPTFLSLFDMFAGYMTPKQIGLTDRHQVWDLCRKSRLLFKIVRQLQTYGMYIYIMYMLESYYISCTLMEIIVYGIPQTILLTFGGHYCIPQILYLFIHFYLICRYCRHKLRSFNEILKTHVETDSKFNPLFIRQTIQSLNDIINEINKYNTTYWCQYIAIMWTLLSISGTTIAYIILFLNMPFMIRLTLVYPVGVTLLPLIFVGLISAAVNKTTDVTYKLLNRYIARHIPKNMAYRRKVLNRWLLAEIRKDLSE